MFEPAYATITAFIGLFISLNEDIPNSSALKYDLNGGLVKTAVDQRTDDIRITLTCRAQ